MKRIFRLRGSWLIFLYETIAKEATALWSPRFRGFQTCRNRILSETLAFMQYNYKDNIFEK